MPEEELLKQVGTFASLPGIKVREIRRQLAPWGIEESTGDAKIDEAILNMPTPEIGPDGMIVDPITGQKTRPIGADRPLPREAGRPPPGENTRVFPSGKAM